MIYKVVKYKDRYYLIYQNKVFYYDFKSIKLTNYYDDNTLYNIFQQDSINNIDEKKLIDFIIESLKSISYYHGETNIYVITLEKLKDTLIIKNKIKELV